MLYWKFSQFLEVKETGKNVIVFHRLNPSLLYIPSNQWCKIKNDIKSIEPLLFEKMKNRKLIIASENDDEIVKKKSIDYCEKKLRNFFVLYLILTQDCNLSCKYCFVRQSFRNRAQKQMMSFSIAYKGITTWFSNVKSNFEKDKYQIIFYGGEPLLNFEVLQQSLLYIDKLCNQRKIQRDKIEISIVTNGTLVEKNIVQLIKRYDIRIILSMDFPEQEHNYCRKDKFNKGSFKRVKRTLKFFQDNEIDPLISTAVTPNNVGILESIPMVFSDLKIRRFGLNPLVGNTFFLFDRKFDLQEYRELAVKNMIKSYIVAKKQNIVEVKIQSRIDAFLQSNFYNLDCGGCGNQMVVYPNGYISNCHASPKYNIKPINLCGDKFEIYQTAIAKKWRERIPLYQDECLNCEAISICGAGCPWSTEEISGDSQQKDTLNCLYAKEVFRLILEKEEVEF